MLVLSDKAMRMFVACVMSLMLLTGSAVAANIRQITFGTTHYYPPFIMTDSNGHLYGFDIEIAQTICQHMHVQCVFKPMLFQKLFASLANNNVDALISALSITPQRSALVNFSQPYLPSYANFIYYVAAKKQPDLNLSHIDKLIIGVQSGAAFSHYIKNHHPDADLKKFIYIADLLDALSRQQVNIVMIDTLAANYWINKNQGIFAITGSTKMVGAGLGIAISKENPVLRDEINKAIQEMMHDGSYKKLLTEYFTLGE